MRQFDRVVLRTFSLGLAATGLFIACSSSNNDNPGGTDAGVDPDTGASNNDSGGSSSGGDAANDTGASGGKCTKNDECPSKVCDIAKGVCQAATCKDGTKNGTETDTDCGGSDCPKCDVSKACKVAGDCTSAVCKDTGSGLKCQAPSCTDTVKNQDESDVDCGGAGCPKCVDGKTCVVRGDCIGDVCNSSKKCATPACNDGIISGTKTDIDCGGPDCPRCIDNRMCKVAGDCQSGVCADVGAGLRCQPPSYTDGVKNGAETDVDCGGDPTHVYDCKAGKACLANTDCASYGCNYAKKCAAGRSCTPRYGGDTCGTGGAGGVGAENWEDCCKAIPVNTATGGAVYLDKYPVTAGRMRAFLEDVGYDVRGFVQGARAGGKIPAIPEKTNLTVDGVNPVLDPSWDMFLPTGFGVTAAGEISDCAQAGTCTDPTGECPATTTCLAGQEQAGIYSAIRNHLGGTIFKNNSQTATGCFVGGPGTHSFRFPAGMQDGAAPEQPQDVYDTKTLNCVDYLVAQAFCVYDGGRLETFSEWQAMWPTAANATPYTAQTTQLPAEPNDRCIATACAPASVNADCGNADPANPTYACVSNKCCLARGDRTYWGCRFPWATDAAHPSCGLTWPANRSIEYSDYKYSYEYPKLGSQDYIVHLSAPGRTAGRGSLGHSDIIGTGFELTSSVNWSAYVAASPPGNTGPFAGRHRWAGNGSWEVHSYSRSYGGTSELLNKYGKLGLRCVKFASYE